MTAFSQVDPVMAAVRAAEASRRAVEVFLGERPELPVARPPVSTPGGVAVVTVADVDGLADWLAACGGTIRRSTPDDGVQTWQLYTSLPPRADGSRVPVRVVTAAAEDVPVADEVLNAVVSGGPRAVAQGPLTPEQLAGIRARVEADYPTVCTACGHGRLAHAIPAPSPCAVRGWLAPGWRCECPGWQHPYIPVGRHDGRQDRRDAVALLAEVERLTARVAELVEQRDDALVDLVGLGAAGVAADVQAAPDDEWVRCSASHCPNAERFTKAPERGWEHCHMDTWLCPKHAPATPAAALLEAMARADGTGLLHCETPARGDTITERGHQMTCTPPALAWARRLDAHGLAAFLLDLAAAAGGYWQRDGHAEVLTRIEQVFAEHEAALAGDKPDACGHDAQDRCENCRCCHACPGTVCELCSVCWCECRCVPPTSDDRRGDDR